MPPFSGFKQLEHVHEHPVPQAGVVRQFNRVEKQLFVALHKVLDEQSNGGPVSVSLSQLSQSELTDQRVSVRFQRVVRPTPDLLTSVMAQVDEASIEAGEGPI